MEYITKPENKFSELINLETGNIKIGTTTTLTKEFLLPFLKTFHKLYSKINIQIVMGSPSELLSKLKSGLIDMLILNFNEKNYGNDIKIIKCKEINDCFITNKENYNLLNKNMSLKDLNNYPLILQLKGSNTREFIDDFAKEYGVVLTPSIELASNSLVVEFTKIGFGIGYATKDYILSELGNNELFEIDLKEKITSRDICIAISNNHLPNFSTKKLMELITK